MSPTAETTRAGRIFSRLDAAAGGLAGDLTLYGLGTVFAALTALASTLAPHRTWGAVAAYGYAAAMLATLAQLAVRRCRPAARLAGPGARALLTGLAWLASTLVPLVLQAVERASGRVDRAQEEVVVVEHGGARLLETGTPYLGRDAIAALPTQEQLLGYLPYQPGMAVFGLPRALAGAGWWTDARVWFAVGTAAALAVAFWTLRHHARPGPLVRAGQFATVLPICALTLATGGDDLPVLALCLLALALCAVRRFGAAGVAVGLAAALKLFAWPVAVVLLAHAATRGRRPATRFAAAAIGIPVAVLAPALLVDAGAVLENLIRFPLGQGVVSSPAQSPLPGYLIATAVPGGRVLAAVLLVAAALAIAVRLLRRPPGTAAGAALITGYGLLAAMLLMPSTRFGYLLYPLALLAWAPALSGQSPGVAAAAATPRAVTPARER